MAVTHRALLQFEAGLLVTSVALVAAGFAAVKDAWTVEAWRLPLLSFIAWMAVTIVAATVAAFVLQLRKTDSAGAAKAKASEHRRDRRVPAGAARPRRRVPAHPPRLVHRRRAGVLVRGGTQPPPHRHPHLSSRPSRFAARAGIPCRYVTRCEMGPGSSLRAVRGDKGVFGGSTQTSGASASPGRTCYCAQDHLLQATKHSRSRLLQICTPQNRAHNGAGSEQFGIRGEGRPPATASPLEET